MSIIAEINLAIEQNNSDQVFRLSKSSEANIEDIHETNLKKYMIEFQIERKKKILNHGDIQEIIDNVNSNLQSNYLQIEALQAINKAVEKCDAPKLRQALLDPNLGLDNELKNELHGIGDDDAIHFLCLMRDFKSNLR